MFNKAKHYTKQWSTKLNTIQSNGQQSKTLHKAMVNKAKHYTKQWSTKQNTTQSNGQQSKTQKT
jgi:hypothetical protein